jgi:hypothetical protein
MEIMESYIKSFEDFKNFLELEDFYGYLNDVLGKFYSSKEAGIFHDTLEDFYRECDAFNTDEKYDDIEYEDWIKLQEDFQKNFWGQFPSENIWVDDFVSVRDLFKDKETGKFVAMQYMPLPRYCDITGYGMGEYTFDKYTFINDWESFPVFHIREKDGVIYVIGGEGNCYDISEPPGRGANEGFLTFSVLIFLFMKQIIDKGEHYEPILEMLTKSKTRKRKFLQNLYKEITTTPIIIDEVSFEGLEPYDGIAERKLLHNLLTNN